MLILGIETSCDDTALALLQTDDLSWSSRVNHQETLHQPYGGVVPELASRDHIRKILPLLTDLLAESGINCDQIDAMAYTEKPGLASALLCGATFGRALGWALQVPTIAVDHLEGHLFAIKLTMPQLPFPFIALLVSGGHTQLYRVEAFGCYDLLGETLDDAAGEAFDKTARLLGLPYPGGRELEKLAQHGKNRRFHFTQPLAGRETLDFSFSGLKTQARYRIAQLHQDSPDSNEWRADIACAFQQILCKTLLITARRAMVQQNCHRLVICGGVSANQYLRQMAQQWDDAEVHFPPLELCTDNAVMIAYVGYQKIFESNA